MIDDSTQETTYEFARDLLIEFNKMIVESTSGKQKELLHMIISKITINRDRDIESIKFSLNKNLMESVIYFV